MGDPLSVTASIIAVLQLTQTVVEYINSVKDASKDRDRILLEISSVYGLLFSLKDLVERRSPEDGWATTVKSLGAANGPLAQFKSALERLAAKLAPVTGIEKVGKALRWPSQKGDILDILNTIERQKSLFSLALLNDHIGLSEAIRHQVRELHNRALTQDCRDIITWLSPLNFWSKQNDVFNGRLEGTGEWLLEDKVFKDWLTGTQRTLWCPGMPGAGKTVLASAVIDFLNRTFKPDEVGVAFLYCSYKEEKEQTPVNLIASLLQQLVQRRFVISDELNKLYKYHIDKKTGLSLNECSELLRTEIARFSKVFIIIDALDEYIEGDGTRDTLLKGLRNLHLDIKLLVTSRHIPTIEREFKNDKRLDIRASDKDVERYLEYRISSNQQLTSHVKKDPSLKDTIVATIVRNAQGMFLLARLHMDSLARKRNRRDLRQALQNLPKEIDGTYDEAMQRIKSQDEGDVELAKQVLSWISYASRPLTVKEIQHALAVQPDDAQINDEALTHEDFLVSVCAGLVVIDQESNTIRLVHFTTQEYFNRIRKTAFPDAQVNIAATCLRYLSFDIFADGPCANDETLESRLREYALLDYATRQWGNHARECSEKAITDLALRFFEREYNLACSVQTGHIPEYRYEGYSQIFPRGVNGLSIAASFGLNGVIMELLIEKGIDVDSKDSYGQTPLSRAAGSGHLEVVKLLVEKEGVDVDSKDRYGRTPLSLAVGSGHLEVVELLKAVTRP